MANTCFVTITVKCDGREELERLHGHLENEIRETDAERRGLCLGSDRCLFDEDMELVDDELKINGCVKWGYDDEEVIALLNYLNGVATVSRLKLEYEELGCCVYGFYLYENGVLEDHYIPCTDFPDCDCDSYYNELDRILEEDGTVNVIMADEAA